MKLEVEPEPLREGWPSALDLSVENPAGSEEVLVVRAARWVAPVRGERAWARPTLGALSFEAGEDCFVLNTTTSLRAPLPLHTGVLLPGQRARSMIQTVALEAAENAALEVEAWAFPLGELGERVYALEEGSGSRPIQRFARGGVLEGRIADSFVLTEGCARREARVEVALEVSTDADAPSARALELAGGGRVLTRVRRLGGAWVVAPGEGGEEGDGRDGARVLVRGEETLRLAPGLVDDRVFEALDRDPPFVPVDLVFRGVAGEAWRDRGQLPLAGADLGQQRLEASELWGLFAGLSDAGCRMRYGPHAAIAHGLIVSG